MDGYRTQNWCFTHYDLEAVERFDDLVRGPDVLFLGWGREICPTSGRPHLQGVIRLSRKSQSVTYVSGLLGGAHVEKMRGTFAQAVEYCAKEGEYSELGDKPEQGQRTDLVELVDQLKEGTLSLPEIIMDNPMMYHKYGRTLEKVAWTIKSQATRTSMTKGIWYHGSTGCGKTHKAMEGLDAGDYYVHTTTDKGWWDNYQQQKVTIIDDFRGGIEYATLLRLVDKWPCCVPVRNVGPVPFVSETVIITSSLPPEEVFHNLAQKDSLDQLLRRFKVVELRGGLQGLAPPRRANEFNP